MGDMKRLLALVLMVIVVGEPLSGSSAVEQSVSSDWKSVDAKGEFSFSLPKDMEPHPIQGQDSYVGEYRSSTTLLNFDYGWYPIDLCDAKYSGAKPQFEQAATAIDGRRARVMTFHDPNRKYDAEFPYVAAVCFDDLGTELGQKVTLSMWTYCKGNAEQEISKKIFYSIKFPRVNK